MIVTAAGFSWDDVVSFADYAELLALVHKLVGCGCRVGIVGGLISTFVVMRDLPFAVHGISELSFAGASGALLFGANMVAGALGGSILAALTIGASPAPTRTRQWPEAFPCGRCRRCSWCCSAWRWPFRSRSSGAGRDTGSAGHPVARLSYWDGV